jgi:hypothetical protein
MKLGPSNIFERFNMDLQQLQTPGRLHFSIFVPMRSPNYGPSKIFGLLMKSAEKFRKVGDQEALILNVPDWSQWNGLDVETIAIYSVNGFTFSIPLPLAMPPRIIIAESFHVKPLVASRQFMLNSLHIHFSHDGASLYRVTASMEILIGHFYAEKGPLLSSWNSEVRRFKVPEYIRHLKEKINSVRDDATRFLGISGNGDSSLIARELWGDVRLPVRVFCFSESILFPDHAFTLSKLQLESEVGSSFSSRVSQTLTTEIANGEIGLSRLGTMIINREISSLCVSLEEVRFGHVDSKTGFTLIRGKNIGVREDDILDDIVELALKNSIEVSVVPQNYLPKGRSFIAS